MCDTARTSQHSKPSKLQKFAILSLWHPFSPLCENFWIFPIFPRAKRRPPPGSHEKQQMASLIFLCIYAVQTYNVWTITGCQNHQILRMLIIVMGVHVVVVRIFSFSYTYGTISEKGCNCAQFSPVTVFDTHPDCRFFLHFTLVLPNKSHGEITLVTKRWFYRVFQ